MFLRQQKQMDPETFETKRIAIPVLPSQMFEKHITGHNQITMWTDPSLRRGLGRWWIFITIFIYRPSKRRLKPIDINTHTRML